MLVDEAVRHVVVGLFEPLIHLTLLIVLQAKLVIKLEHFSLVKEVVGQVV